MAFSMLPKLSYVIIKSVFMLRKSLLIRHLGQIGRNGGFSLLKLVYHLHILYELYRKMHFQNGKAEQVAT